MVWPARAVGPNHRRCFRSADRFGWCGIRATGARPIRRHSYWASARATRSQRHWALSRSGPSLSRAAGAVSSERVLPPDGKPGGGCVTESVTELQRWLLDRLPPLEKSAPFGRGAERYRHGAWPLLTQDINIIARETVIQLGADDMVSIVLTIVICAQNRSLAVLISMDDRRFRQVVLCAR